MNEKKPLSLMFIILVMAMFCSYHIYYYFINKNNNDLVKEYDYFENNTKSYPQHIVEKVRNENIHEQYYAILKISKINLVEGFYNVDNKKNNVDTSVTMLKESIAPNHKGSVMYLAAHSGTGYLAYFKDLDKLEINDIIIINYQNNDYKYIVNEIYEEEKNGKITVNHNIHENYLVLTTCSKNKNQQLVITSKLINKN